MESTIDDDDDDESILLALAENIRATEHCSRELELSNKRTHRQSVSSTQKPTEIIKHGLHLKTASSGESLEIPEQIAENVEQKQKSIKKTCNERTYRQSVPSIQEPTEIIKYGLNLKTASATCGGESIKIPEKIAKNVKRKNIKKTRNKRTYRKSVSSTQKPTEIIKYGLNLKTASSGESLEIPEKIAENVEQKQKSIKKTCNERTYRQSVPSTQEPTEIIKHGLNLKTASATCGGESIKIPEKIAENVKQKNIKKTRNKRTYRKSVSSTKKPTEIIKYGLNLKTASSGESLRILEQIAENVQQKQNNFKKTSKSLSDLLIKKRLQEGSRKSASSVKYKEEEASAKKFYSNSKKYNMSGKSKNKSLNDLEDLFNGLPEIDEFENIDVESDIDDDILIDLADKIVSNTLECEKIEREYQSEKRIKEKHISSQSKSFVSGKRNSEELKKVELLNHLYVHELLIDGSKSEEELTEDDITKARRAILAKQAFLEKLEGSIQKALESNLHLQEYISKPSSEEELLKKLIKPWNVNTNVVFGMRYFKGKDKTMSCPPNADTRSLIENGLLLSPFRDDSGSWSSNEAKQLMRGVQELLRAKISDQLNKNINPKAMSLLELMSKASIDDDYDWEVISINTFFGFRSPNECKCKFKMILDPTLNQSKWGEQEKKKLLLLADRYCYQDWDAIAIDLGTNRSAYQCCVHFQSEMSTNVRSAGKWSKEEDDKLVEAVSKYQAGNNIPWNVVSFAVNSRSTYQMRTRWIEALAPHRKKGRFSTEEDKLLLKAIDMYGHNFKLVAATFPNRTLNQVKGRFWRKLGGTTAKGHWSVEEDKKLMKLVNEIGAGKWKAISDHFVTRTRTQIRQRYNYIKSVLEEYPNLDVEEIYRRVSRKSNKKSDEVTIKSEAVGSNSSDTLNKSVEEKTDESDLTKDATINNITSKQKSEVSVDIMQPAKQMETSCVTNEDHKTVLSQDAPTKCTKRTRKRKSEVSVDSMPPPKQIKTAVPASNEDQRRYDQILRAINQKPFQRTAAGNKLISYFQETYPMQAIVSKRVWDEYDISAQAKLIFDLSHILRVDFSFSDDLSRHKALRPPLLRQIVKRMLDNHGDGLMRLNPLTIDHQANAEVECARHSESDASFISPIDYVPVPVEETLCPDPLPEDFDDSNDYHLFLTNQNKEADRQKQKHLELVKEKKRKFMDFEFLVPPNVASAVGYRSLLLVERKLKDADPPDTDSAPSSPHPPDYTSTEFRMRDVYEPLPTAAPPCDVRFTKQEAIQMFRDRLKALFAGPIVMGESVDRYFNVNNLPVYKKDAAGKYRRRTTADRHREIIKAKLSSATQKVVENVKIELAPTETPYSMPKLDIMESGAGPSALFDNTHTTASSSVNNCIASTSTSSLCKSNSSPVNKRKCPVKTKISATKTIDFSQPSTSKNTAYQPSSASKVDNFNPSTSTSSSKPSVQKQVSRKRPRSNSQTPKPKK